LTLPFLLMIDYTIFQLLLYQLRIYSNPQAFNSECNEGNNYEQNETSDTPEAFVYSEVRGRNNVVSMFTLGTTGQMSMILTSFRS